MVLKCRYLIFLKAQFLSWIAFVSSLHIFVTFNSLTLQKHIAYKLLYFLSSSKRAHAERSAAATNNGGGDFQAEA